MESSRKTAGALIFSLAFLYLVITYYYIVNLADTVVELSGYFFAVFVFPLVGCLSISFVAILTIAKTLDRTQKVMIILVPFVTVLGVISGLFYIFQYIGMH